MSIENFEEFLKSDEFKQQVAAQEEERFRCKLPRTTSIFSGLLPRGTVRTSWGPWSLNREYLTLHNKEAGYDVDLEEINTIYELLDWILHIHGKNHRAFGGCQQANDFIQALKDIFPHRLRIQKKWDATATVKAYMKKAFPRRDVSAKLRHQILERDGFRCCDCGATPDMPGVVLEVDHRNPVAKGGSNDPSNLRTLCGDCNRGKSDRIVDYPEGHK